MFLTVITFNDQAGLDRRVYECGGIELTVLIIIEVVDRVAVRVVAGLFVIVVEVQGLPKDDISVRRICTYKGES